MKIVDGYFGKKVEAKLHKMRKPQTFSVMPTRRDDVLMVQSDKSIGMFDFRTRKGILNVKGSYFPHLNRALGAMDFEFPAEFVKLCLEVCPPLDSETSRGGVTVVNTVEVG